MDMKKISTTLLVITAVAFLVLLAFHVRIGATTDAIAILKTSGLTCGSCSYRATTALESLQGVAATEVDVGKGWVIVGYDTKTVQPRALAEKVNSAGFGCTVQMVLTPEQFRQITGKTLGQAGGCGVCGAQNNLQ